MFTHVCASHQHLPRQVALHFVREPKTRFKLALACGNIEIAMETAFQLEQDEGNSNCWHELGVEALRQGNHQVVEMAYQRTKDFDRLSFLYVLTGNTDKLHKMAKISTMRNDIMGRYHNALFLGDAEERVKVLEASGNINLAYVTAKVHGMEEEAERMKGLLEAAEKEVPEITGNKTLLQPPTPILRGDNWPAFQVIKNTLEDLKGVGDDDTGHLENDDFTGPEVTQSALADAGDGPSDPNAWGDDLDTGADAGGGNDDFDAGDGGWGDDELDLGDDDVAPSPAKTSGGMEDVTSSDSGFFQMPSAGTPKPSKWVQTSSHAADHAAAGSFETAMNLLNRQIAASNFDAVKSKFLMAYMGNIVSASGMPSTPSLKLNAERKPGLPAQVHSLQAGVMQLRKAYQFFQGGKFSDAADTFSSILLMVPMIVVDNKSDASQLKELLENSREYITAIRIKAAMGECTEPARSTELSAYFTHCNLQPAHLLLALRSAMGTAFKHKNFIAAASFSRRLLELPEVGSEKNADLKSKATKVLQKSEQMARNEHTLDYDEAKQFVIDAKNLTPLYRGSDMIKCSFCGSCYASECNNTLCLTCKLSVVGVSTLGLVTGA